MQITFNPGEATTDELTALIALLASLGGRLPTSRTDTIQLDVKVDPADVHEKLAALPVEEIAPATTLTAMAVDANGTPWDARIHSDSKAVNADKTWRKRRGVDDATFAAVMAELTAAGEDEAPPPPPPDDPTGNDDTVPAPPAPTAEEPSDPAPAPNAPAAGDGQFADFPAFVGAVSKHGKTYAELNEMAAMLGVPMFKDMKDHPDQWDTFFAMIG